MVHHTGLIYIAVLAHVCELHAAGVYCFIFVDRYSVAFLTLYRLS